MKKRDKMIKYISVAAFALMVSFTAKAQQIPPNGFNYQAVARNASGSVLANQTFNVRVNVLSDTTVNTPQYREIHYDVKTNQFGLFNLVIGQGQYAGGLHTDLYSIPWDVSNQFIQIEMDLGNGGFTPIGIMQLYSVPYAFYAGKVKGSGTPGPQGPTGPAGLNGINGANGPQGPQGIQGAQGPAGPQGLQGLTGPQGPAGANGIAGPQGPQGADGVAGAQGPQGVEGPMGPQGPAGADGVAGPQGPQGIAGVDGAVGPMGPQGEQGPQGLQGVAGVDGAAGPMGPQGPQGEQGVAGPQGEQGAPGSMGLQGLPGQQGPMGLQGEMGPQGPQGEQGVAGPQGLQGIAGADGAVGPMGPQGEMGPQGLQGIAGVDGAVGPMGPQGEMGPQGLQGVAGVDGAVGPMGPQGEQGPQGLQGIAGVDGLAGPMGPQGPAGVDGVAGPQGPQGVAGADGAVGPMGPQGVAGADGAVGPQGEQGVAGPQGEPGFIQPGNENGNSPYWNGTEWVRNSSYLYNDGTRIGINTQNPQGTFEVIGGGIVDGVQTTGSSAIAVNIEGNVGMGTTSPAAKLDVIGSVKITDGSEGAGKILVSDANGLATWSDAVAVQGPAGADGAQGPQGEPGLLQPGHDAGNSPYWNGTEWVRNSSFIYNDGTKVGINTQNPQGTFEVIGGGIVDGVQTTGSSAIAVNIEGNVGMGTTSPAAKLDVIGSVKITDGSEGAGKILVSDANGLATWSDAAAVQGPQGIQGEVGPQGEQGPQGEVGAQGPAGVDGLDGAVGPMGPQGVEGPQGPQGEVGAQGPAGNDGLDGAVGPMGPQGVEGPQGPQGDPATDDQELSFSGTTLSISGGNSVQIPVLAAGTSANNTLRWDGSNWVENPYITADEWGGLNTSNLNTGFINAHMIHGVWDGYIDMLHSNYISTSFIGANYMNTSGLEVYDNMGVISGNVGIGMYAGDAQAKLDINGNIRINDGTQGAGRVLTSNADGFAYWADPSSGSSQWGTNGNKIYYENDYVGIGVNDPQVRLQIEGGNNSPQIRLSDDVDLWDVSEGNTLGIIGQQDPSYGRIKLGLDGGSILGHNGNVGINSWDPQASLQVDGSLRFVTGNQGAGKVLTSDADGFATWQNPMPGASADYSSPAFGTISSTTVNLDDISTSSRFFILELGSDLNYFGEVDINLPTNPVYGAVYTISYNVAANTQMYTRIKDAGHSRTYTEKYIYGGYDYLQYEDNNASHQFVPVLKDGETLWIKLFDQGGMH